MPRPLKRYKPRVKKYENGGKGPGDPNGIRPAYWSSDDLREYVGEKAWEKIQEAIRKYPMDFDHNAENIEMYAYLNDPDDVDYDPERYIEKTTPKMGRSLDILNTFVPEGNNNVYGEDIMTRVGNELKFAPYVESLPMESLPMESLPIDYGLPEPTWTHSQAPKTGRDADLIMRTSNKTRTGQEPNYYRYFDNKGNPKTRPVEPEEYDRYMRENRIHTPQVIKATFNDGGKVKPIKKYHNGGKGPGHPHSDYQDSLDVYNNQEELNRLSEAYNAHIEKHTSVFSDSSTGGMQRSYHSNREAREAGNILLNEFRTKKFELFKEFHKKFPDLDNPYALEVGNPDFYDSDADIATGKQTWGTNKYKTVKPIEEKEVVKKTLVKKEKPLTIDYINPSPLKSIVHQFPEPTIRTSQATPKVNTGKWSKPILEYSPSGGQGWQTGTYQYETGKGPKIRKDEPEEIAWNKYEALLGTRWEIPKPGYAKGGKVKAIKKSKMKTLKNGGTPQGDPPPEGYKYNESGSLEPIGWSEFHEEGNIDMDDLMRGVSAVESGGGQEIFMINPNSSATGQYQQLYKEIKDMDFMKGISRDDFAKDRDLQNRVFNMRYMGELPDIPGLENNAYDLTKDYAEDLGDKWEYTLDEVAALSNFIGRKGTRKFFEALGRGETYTPPGLNKTVEQYLKEYREGRDNYEKGGKFKLKKKMRLLKMMFGGGRLPYNDYGMDDSIGMSYQNSSDQFMDMNSTLTGGIPQDSVQAQDPQFEVPVFQSKKEMRKEKRKGVRTVRQTARDARKQARNPERYARRQQMKLIKDDRKTGKFDAKSIKDWKDYS
jgi:hypothetical protein